MDDSKGKKDKKPKEDVTESFIMNDTKAIQSIKTPCQKTAYQAFVAAFKNYKALFDGSLKSVDLAFEVNTLLRKYKSKSKSSSINGNKVWKIYWLDIYTIFIISI